MGFKFSWKKIWEELASDILYSNENFVNELIKEAINALDITIDFYSNNKLLDTIQPAHKSRIRTIFPIHIDQESCGQTDSQDGSIRDQVKLLHLWCLLGLDTYYRNSFTRSLHQHIQYLFISSSTSILAIDYLLFKSFLRNLKLPLPQRLYPQEQDNTQNIFLALVKTPSQQIDILDDVRRLVAEKYFLLKDLYNYSFFLEGDFFNIRFGDESCHLNKTKGLSYIQYLIDRAFEKIDVSDLYYSINKFPDFIINEQYTRISGKQLEAEGLSIKGNDTISDGFSIAEIKKIKDKLKELNDELDYAKRFNKLDQVPGLLSRIRMAEEYLKAKPDMKGSIQRKRKSVAKAIKEARIKISDKCPRFASHLKNSLSTGTTCTYHPEPPIDWLGSER
jgi:hypothetical protein